eukprot:CAMPEP_0113994838 /NCGR_PEP_ID=MMETSP0328-20130328/10890_1 /TAXON_ID=39455 /ORGANISM="Alexandrium minutum" /LENGTH=38 /assembly_acc=CAM_ASM_000350
MKQRDELQRVSASSCAHYRWLLAPPLRKACGSRRHWQH